MPRLRLVVWLAAAALAAVWLTAAARQTPAPILILISFDGWRWDYLDFDAVDAPHLRALAARGVRSEGLIPSFPTSTFPNHFTLVTGLYPDRHGIVSNSIVDRTIGPERFTMSSQTATDPRWWNGEPIWTTAIRQGRRSATMFWPGSEAIHPTYWKPFQNALPNADRVAQALTWLALPEAERPSVVTIYFSDTDTAAHQSGPRSPAVIAAARRLDESLGQLQSGLARLGLADRTTIVVVSDHGMSETSSDRRIFLSDYIADEAVDVVDSGALLAINPRAGRTVDEVFRALSGRHPSLSISTRETVPAELHYGRHPRVPAIIGLAAPGWLVQVRRPAGPPLSPPRIGGAHGYDSRHRDMHGLFVAAGPRIRRGLIAPRFENVHVYAFLCAVLGLTPAANDGEAAVTAAWFTR